jgi:hypothetical protein
MDDASIEIAKVGFNYAKDLAQQLITLSTGILALTITFTKDIVKDIPASPFWILKAAWVTFLFSICCGIWTLMALTGTLMPRQATSIENRLAFGSSLLPAQLQILSFVVGITLIIIYGARSLRQKAQKKREGLSEEAK